MGFVGRENILYLTKILQLPSKTDSCRIRKLESGDLLNGSSNGVSDWLISYMYVGSNESSRSNLR